MAVLPSDKFSGCSCSHSVVVDATTMGGTTDVGDVFRFKISSMHNLDRLGGGGGGGADASCGGLMSVGLKSSLIKVAAFLLKSLGVHNIDTGDSGESGSSNIDSSSKSDSSDCGDFLPFGDSELRLPPLMLLLEM